MTGFRLKRSHGAVLNAAGASAAAITTAPPRRFQFSVAGVTATVTTQNTAGTGTVEGWEQYVELKLVWGTILEHLRDKWRHAGHCQCGGCALVIVGPVPFSARRKRLGGVVISDFHHGLQEVWTIQMPRVNPAPTICRNVDRFCLLDLHEKQSVRLR